MKKNKLAIFLFSLVPGAGEMYYGMYKSGCSIMGLFMGAAALAISLQMPELLFGLPIIWFYSFCHVHNIKHMDEKTFAMEKDEVLFGQWSKSIPEWGKNGNRYSHKIIAGLLIAVGGIMIWNNLCVLLTAFEINWELYNFLRYRFPELVLGVGIILAGFWLIRGKKAELEQGSEEALDSIFEREFLTAEDSRNVQEHETVQAMTGEKQISDVQPQNTEEAVEAVLPESEVQS